MREPLWRCDEAAPLVYVSAFAVGVPPPVCWELATNRKHPENWKDYDECKVWWTGTQWVTTWTMNKLVWPDDPSW